MYKKEDNIYVFDGNFERYLLDIGVDYEHIEKMKQKNLQSNKDDYYFIDEQDEGEYLVPLEKVIGTSRGTVGDSVFNNVRVMRDGVREPSRFYNCFHFLDNMTLEELKLSYEKLFYPVVMKYYEEDDEYYVSSDGNHRTLTAMLIGAKYIKAKVYSKHCDVKRKNKYIATNEFFDRYNICQISKRYSRSYDITFKEDNEYYVVSGFGIRESNEDCYDLIKRLSYEIESDKKELKVWLKFPEKLRNILQIFCRRKRMFQYMNKKKQGVDPNNKIIYLYDF